MIDPGDEGISAMTPAFRPISEKGGSRAGQLHSILPFGLFKSVASFRHFVKSDSKSQDENKRLDITYGKNALLKKFSSTVLAES